MLIQTIETLGWKNPKQGAGRIKYISTVKLIGNVGSDQTSSLPSDLYKY